MKSYFVFAALCLTLSAQAQESNNCVPHLRIKENAVHIEACGRRLEQMDAAIAFVNKTPDQNKMPRLWRSLSDYKNKTVTPDGIVFDGTDCYPKVILSTHADKKRLSETSFVQIQIKVIPKQCSQPLVYEGHRFIFKYVGQASYLNNQSYFSYYSFAFNGVMKEVEGGLSLEDGAPAYSATESTLYREKKGVAWWLTTLKSINSHESLFLGAQSARVLPTTYLIQKKSDHHEVNIYQGLQGDYIPLIKDQLISADPVLISINDNAVKTMEDYGSRVAAFHKLQLSKPSDLGWATWYQYYTKISPQIILEASKELKEKLFSFGFHLLQVDDGYQKKAGDWTDLKENFEKQFVENLPVKIKNDGLRAGIWLAPFMVDKKSKLAQSVSSNWFLHDYKGNFLTYYIPGHSTNYILDVTNPEVEKYLLSIVKYYRDSGYNYLKIDFLFLEAAAAKRFDPRFSGIAAYIKGLSIIRKAAGSAVTLLLSGSIDLPGLGLGDANRVGPDIAYDVFGGNTRLAYIKAELSAVASHFFMGQRWFTPNTDALMLREPLDESLAEVLLAMAAMTSGDYILSDKIASLSQERLNKLTHPVILEMVKSKGHVIPLDYFEHSTFVKVPPNPLMISLFYDPPQIWLWTNPKNSRKFLLIYNLSGSKQTIERNLNDLSQEVYGKKLFVDGSWVDIFHGDALNIQQGKIKLAIPAQTVRVFPLL